MKRSIGINIIFMLAALLMVTFAGVYYLTNQAKDFLFDAQRLAVTISVVMMINELSSLLPRIYVLIKRIQAICC